MSGTNETIYDNRDEKLVCYLGNTSNGGIDLYEEYNKGIDKIVDAFQECAKKLEDVENCKEKQDVQIKKNIEERNITLSDLEMKIANGRQSIREKDEELYSFEERTRNDFDTQKKNVQEETLKTQNELQEKMDSIKKQCDSEIQNMESKYKQEADVARRQLSNTKAKYQVEIQQLETEVNNLEHQIEAITKDEEIQKELQNYKANENCKREAFKSYYKQMRRAGSVEQEENIRQQLSNRIQNKQAEVEKNAIIKLEREGLKKELLKGASTIIRDEKEINRLSEIYARNVILGALGNKKIDQQKRWKKIGMLIYCFPRLLLGDNENRELDQKTLVPVSLFILLSYFYFPGIHISVFLGIVTMVLYFALWRKQGTMKGLEIFAKAGIFKLICMLFYPYYLGYLVNSEGFLVWAVLSFCLCCGSDILYSFKMKKKKNKEKYKELFHATKNQYLEKISLTDTAVKKYQLYYSEESHAIQEVIQKLQMELEEISFFNTKEKETLEKQFETSGWNELVEKRQSELLKKRENQIENNAKITHTISEKKEGIQDKKSKISLVDKKIQELDLELETVTKEQKKELETFYNQKYQAHEKEYEQIQKKTEEKIKQFEQEMYEKIAKKKQFLVGEKEKLQKEVNRLDEYERREIEEAFRQKEKEIEIQFRDELNHLTTSYRQKMDENLAKLKENGFADFSGFNYIKAWSRLHPLVSNTIGFPSRLDTYCSEILVGLTARATKANYEYCEIMPKHVAWGYESANKNLPFQIKNEIADTLKKFTEFQGIEWREDSIHIPYYHTEDLPVNDLYKMKCTPFKDGPSVIAYDLGNLDEDIELREELRDFILRSFTFSSFHCLGSDAHLNCHIVSMNHQADYISFRNPLEERLKLNVLENKADIGQVLKKLREDKEAVKRKLVGSDDLYETNVKLSRDNLTPEDIYEILIVINTDYKELDNSDLNYLMELSREKGIGLYSMLFVDVNEINRMENSEKSREVESIQKLANAINQDSRFYSLEREDERCFCLKKDSKSGFMERIS